MQGTWKTTSGGGGDGLGNLAGLVLVAIVVAAIAGPVVHAVADIVQTVLIVGGVLLAVLVAGGIALVALRLRRGQAGGVTAVAFHTPRPQRPAESLTAPRSRADIERDLADTRAQLAQLQAGAPGPQHVHFHGLSAQDVAAIIGQHGTREHP